MQDYLNFRKQTKEKSLRCRFNLILTSDLTLPCLCELLSIAWQQAPKESKKQKIEIRYLRCSLTVMKTQYPGFSLQKKKKLWLKRMSKLQGAWKECSFPSSEGIRRGHDFKTSHAADTWRCTGMLCVYMWKCRHRKEGRYSCPVHRFAQGLSG